jgi:hypothetical protein
VLGSVAHGTFVADGGDKFPLRDAASHAAETSTAAKECQLNYEVTAIHLQRRRAQDGVGSGASSRVEE